MGVYYQKSDPGFEVYLYCKITQDITGGLRADRAKAIAKVLCDHLNTCLLAYPVNTKISEQK